MENGKPAQVLSVGGSELLKIRPEEKLTRPRTNTVAQPSSDSSTLPPTAIHLLLSEELEHFAILMSPHSTLSFPCVVLL